MTIRNRTDVHAVPVPASPLADGNLPRVDWADAFAAPIPPGAAPDPAHWVDRVFHRPPPWVLAAMAARNALVAPLGLKTPPSASKGFPVLGRTDDEMLMGLDDRHLDFRVSVLVRDGILTVATRVRIRNALGRAYFAPVRLVHPVVVRAMLARAVARAS
jgi:hypothetical protein